MTDTQTVEKPITLEELQRRGMDEAMESVVENLIHAGSRVRREGRYPVTREQMWAFGFGPPCECGERGLEPGEEACKLCEEENDE